jgi:hypothetical protein
MSTATATASKKTTSTSAESKAPAALKEGTQALANAIAASLSVANDGTITFDGDVVEANLPPDLTIADIKKTQKYRTDLIAASVDALRQKALPVMGEHKEIERIEAAFKFGDDQVEVGVRRSQTFNDGKGGQVMKQGHVVIGYTAKGTGNSGEFKKARDLLAAEAATLFG